MTENVKMNFFKKLILSIKDLDKYDQLAIQPLRKGISYFVKLILLISIILSVMYTIQAYQLFSTTKEKINDIPDFEYKDGTLAFKEKSDPILFEDVSNIVNCILIIPDTNKEKTDEYISRAKTYNSCLTLNKDKFSIAIKDNKLDFSYKDLFEATNITSFNKEDVKKLVDNINIISLSIAFFLEITAYLFLWNLFAMALDVMITFLVSYITSKFARIKLKLTAMINIAIHSLSLPIILYMLYNIVNILTGFEISNFRVMYILVASIYAWISVLIIKADFIEKQIELAKVIKEQQNIRKEMDEQENNDTEEESKEKDNRVEEPPEDKNENEVQSPEENVSEIKEENN